MKIKLLDDIPVESEHGLTKGRILETVHRPDSRFYWVEGDTGEVVKLFNHEYEIVPDENTDQAETK